MVKLIYVKNDCSWFVQNRIEDAKIMKYAKICNARFIKTECNPLGLELFLDIEDYGSVFWVFYNTEDIDNFLDCLKVDNVNSIIGKVVKTWWEKEDWGCHILGIGVNTRLV